MTDAEKYGPVGDLEGFPCKSISEVNLRMLTRLECAALIYDDGSVDAIRMKNMLNVPDCVEMPSSDGSLMIFSKQRFLIASPSKEDIRRHFVEVYIKS